jgi:hypothetical protein
MLGRYSVFKEFSMSVEEVRSRATDALALWGQESVSASPVGLSAVRLDANERLVIPFTTALLRSQVHYFDSTAIQGYVHCLGSACLLCRLGRQVDVRDLLPVYDAVDKVVGVLPVSPNLRPNALRPQLMPILQRLNKEQRKLLVGIRKPEKTRFIVAVYDLPEQVDDGADVILRFTDEFQAGRIDLGSVFPRLTNEELAAVPEVAAMMAMKGVKLS